MTVVYVISVSMILSRNESTVNILKVYVSNVPPSSTYPYQIQTLPIQTVPSLEVGLVCRSYSLVEQAT